MLKYRYGNILLDAPGGGGGGVPTPPAGPDVTFAQIHGQLQGISNDIKTRFASVEARVEKAERQILSAAAGAPGTIRRASEVVSRDCALFLAAIVIQAAGMQGKLDSHKQKDAVLGFAAQTLGLETATALTTTNIPMPVNYGAEVAELVYAYGQSRKICTVLPLGTLTTKLPRLKTSPAFGVIAMSASVSEKSPEFEWVTFTAFKIGGIIRIPSEIDQDSVVLLGNFVARYAAREMAAFEDTAVFKGDGTATYGSVQGFGKQAETDGAFTQIAGASPSEVTLANLRTLRTQMATAGLSQGRYFMHPTMDALLVSFNTGTNLTVYKRADNAGPATLDGWPIEWINVFPVYSTSDTINQYIACFGDARWVYLGVAQEAHLVASRDVYFATDEIGVRAIERIDCHNMIEDSIAALKLAAS